MKLSAFTVRDSCAEAFIRPFFAQSPGAAIRSFSDEVNGGDSPVSSHPQDYTLFEIGVFDCLTGILDAHEPRSLGNGATFLLVPESAGPPFVKVDDTGHNRG